MQQKSRRTLHQFAQMFLYHVSILIANFNTQIRTRDAKILRDKLYKILEKLHQDTIDSNLTQLNSVKRRRPRKQHAMGKKSPSDSKHAFIVNKKIIPVCKKIFYICHQIG